jgi:hypothetical protein
MPEDCGSTTLSAHWMAAAASMALPPASSMRAPASAASGCETDTTPRGARASGCALEARSAPADIASAASTRPANVRCRRWIIVTGGLDAGDMRGAFSVVRTEPASGASYGAAGRSAYHRLRAVHLEPKGRTSRRRRAVGVGIPLTFTLT